MWNGGRGQEEDGKEDPDNRIRLAALAAYAAGGNVDPNYRYDPRFPAAQFAQATNPMLYQSQAVEALRRQEEMQLRQQALYSLQQQQVLQQHQELQELEYARLLQQQQLVEQQRREALAAQQQKGIMERCENDIASRQHDGVGRYVADMHALAAPVEEFHRGKEVKGDRTSQTDLESYPEGQGGRTPQTPEPMEVEEPKKLATQAIRGKPEAMAAAVAAAWIRKEMEEEEEVVATAVPVADDAVVEVDAQAEVAVAASPFTETPKKKAPKKKRATPTPKPKKRQSTPPGSSGPTLDDPVPPITEDEYENVVALMEQFCRVPLLAEFSRPLSQLHPEVSFQVERASLYSNTFTNIVPPFLPPLVVSKVFPDCQSSY
jgi:hypothetical protein